MHKVLVTDSIAPSGLDILRAAEAVELARHIPWTRVGSVEVRAIGAFGVVPEYP